MSTAGHRSNWRSEKLSRSWSKARTLYLQGHVGGRRKTIKTAEGLKRTTCRNIPVMSHNLRLSIQSPSSSSRVPEGWRLWRTGIRPPRVCRWPHRYATADLNNKRERLTQVQPASRSRSMNIYSMESNAFQLFFLLNRLHIHTSSCL